MQKEDRCTGLDDKNVHAGWRCLVEKLICDFIPTKKLSWHINPLHLCALLACSQRLLGTRGHLRASCIVKACNGLSVGRSKQQLLLRPAETLSNLSTSKRTVFPMSILANSLAERKTRQLIRSCMMCYFTISFIWYLYLCIAIIYKPCFSGSWNCYLLMRAGEVTWNPTF